MINGSHVASTELTAKEVDNACLSLSLSLLDAILIAREFLLAATRALCNPAGRQDQPIRVAAFPYCPSCVSVSDGKAVSPSRARPTSIFRGRLGLPPRARSSSVAREGQEDGREERSREEREAERVVITTPAGPSDARGSVAIVLPHLPSICRRSIFNELPASPRPSLPTMPPVLLSLPLDDSVLLTHLHRLAHIVDLAAQPPDREFTASVTSALMKPSPSYNINASRDYEHIISTAQAYRCPNTRHFGKPRGNHKDISSVFYMRNRERKQKADIRRNRRVRR